MTLTSKAIDDAIDAAYGRRTGGGELKQLAKLFSAPFWRDFEGLLNREFTRSSGPYRQKVSIGLGYIDKIPVAELKAGTLDAHNRPITQKTEIGDAALLFVDTRYLGNGAVQSRSARGLILQAKQATTGALPKVVPIVPLPSTQNSSTLKELALLSSWPTFDLYFTAGSQEALQKGYQVCEVDDDGHVDSPRAWYIGASPKVNVPWKPRWIAGPSQNGAVCSESLGSILNAVLQNDGRIGGTESVGKAFDFNPTRLQAPDFKLASSSTPPNWDDLCHQLMLACNAYALPHHLFRRPSKAAGRGVGVQLHANPIEPALAALSSLVRKIAQRFGFLQERRFPVVLIERESGEGAFMSEEVARTRR